MRFKNKLNIFENSEKFQNIFIVFSQVSFPLLSITIKKENSYPSFQPPTYNVQIENVVRK
jgi:hypothetical protein